MTNTIRRIIELARQIQQIPAPTFHELKRAEFVRDVFMSEELSDVSMDELGNVYGLLKARGSASKIKPLIVSAHTDTVFPLDMDLKSRHKADKVYGIGIGDNSLGVAGLVGLLWMIRERNIKLKGDVWFVANVCEEGLGDLRGMKAVVDRFGENVLAYLVLEGMALGHVYHRAVGVQRYRVKATTRGGHSWSDYGQPSAIHELSRLVVQLTSLELPREPRTTMNVGKISGGTSINVIAPEACFELDLRSEGQNDLAKLVADAEKLIREANRPGLRIEAEVIGQRSAGELNADHPLIQLAVECVREQGLDAILTTGSTDANIPLSKNYPALVLGISTGSGAHTKEEYINTAPVEKGMEQLVKFVREVWSTP
ncbi:MAG TPA: M20/M25/M40 family metallo-hydrolase [Anaerolineales bacterium]|nr:M20/M25/M40 family metallo-hydrolase [Anaerolineales bacterium]